MKADLLRARNVKRYINQLTVAKKQCEKRIRLLGGPAYDQQDDGTPDEGDGPPSQKVRIVYSQNEILKCLSILLHYLSLFKLMRSF